MSALRLVALGALLLAGTSCGDDARIATSRTDAATGVATDPTCEEVEAFADALVDTGITYDYQPSQSPAELASLTDAVFGGRLTGRTTTTELTAAEGDLHARPFVGYEVEITRVVKGGPGLQEAARVNVFVDHGGMQHRSNGSEDAVAPGASVAVLAFEHEELDGLTASIEGFMTSCAAGPLMGWTGDQGEWASLQTTQQQVLDAVERSGTSSTTATSTTTTSTTSPSTTSPSTTSPSSTTSPPDRPGATAVWRVDDEDPPTTSSTSFSALVTRIGCNGGRTGEVYAPKLRVDDDEIVVTFSVEAPPDGASTCPSNDEVPYRVEIGEPIGQRTLVDGACLDGAAASTSFCSEGGTRWRP